jgi:malate dehydrogenase
VLGANGVEKIIEFALDKDEKALLDNSVKAVTNLVADMERLGF